MSSGFLVFAFNEVVGSELADGGANVEEVDQVFCLNSVEFVDIDEVVDINDIDAEDRAAMISEIPEGQMFCDCCVISDPP